MRSQDVYGEIIEKHTATGSKKESGLIRQTYEYLRGWQSPSLNLVNPDTLFINYEVQE